MAVFKLRNYTKKGKTKCRVWKVKKSFFPYIDVHRLPPKRRRFGGSTRKIKG
jgi:hypothetical protein